MTAPGLLFTAFVVLAGFNAGVMTTLQVQHYGIYPSVGREAFAGYVRANNRAAFVPAIAPAMLLLIVSAALVFTRPSFMRATDAHLALALNLVSLASTFIWQRPLQSQMARSGYDESKTRRLIATNWIRTAAFGAQAILAGAIVLRAAGAV